MSATPTTTTPAEANRGAHPLAEEDRTDDGDPGELEAVERFHLN